MKRQNHPQDQFSGASTRCALCGREVTRSCAHNCCPEGLVAVRLAEEFWDEV